MNCVDFEKFFDRYVDGLLDGDGFAACEQHVAMCSVCDRDVARWQQTSILLSTAVADFASVVDVSGLRSSVEAALGLPQAAEPGRRALDREASYGRAVGERPASRTGRGASQDAGRGRRATFAATVRFVSAAAVSAATAAAAVLLLTPTPQVSSTLVASAPVVGSAPSSSSGGAGLFMPASLRNGGHHVAEDVATVAYAPPPLAQPQVSHVDGLEAAPGRQVSTWVQPKTNARVIWVEDRGMGAPVRTAGLDR